LTCVKTYLVRLPNNVVSVDLLCYDRKARTASAQSFTLWQQATIEITRRDHSRCHHKEEQSTIHQVHKHC